MNARNFEKIEVSSAKTVTVIDRAAILCYNISENRISQINITSFLNDIEMEILYGKTKGLTNRAMSRL